MGSLKNLMIIIARNFLDVSKCLVKKPCASNLKSLNRNTTETIVTANSADERRFKPWRCRTKLCDSPQKTKHRGIRLKNLKAANTMWYDLFVVMVY